MKTARFVSHVFATICLGLAATAVSTAHASILPNTLDNAGFQTKPAGSYVYIGTALPGHDAPNNPALYGWSFSGGSGIAANGSAFNVVGAPGGNAGFLQSVSSFSQAFDFVGNMLSLSFVAESRNGQDGGNPVNVLIDDIMLTFGAASTFTPTTKTTFTNYTSNFINLASGSHTVTFNGLGVVDKDVTTFIDSVSIKAVPEPGTVALLGLGLLGFAMSRKKRLK